MTAFLLSPGLRLLPAIIIASGLLSGCAAHKSIFAANGNGASGIGSGQDRPDFLESGSIILSHQVPARGAQTLTELAAAAEKPAPNAPKIMAPLIGYFPPANGFVPANNETWMQIDSVSHKLALYRGTQLIREIPVEGEVAIASGDYLLQHKQKDPVWYAPDSYFAKRLLNVPPAGDRLRYRRGALGEFALYPTPSFPIHSAAVWTNEVGGLRVNAQDLSSLFLDLPVGAPIVIK